MKSNSVFIVVHQAKLKNNNLLFYLALVALVYLLQSEPILPLPAKDY